MIIQDFMLEDVADRLRQGQKVVIKGLSGRNHCRIYSLSVLDVQIRAKSTRTQTVLVKDTNDAFIRALFGHLHEEWRGRCSTDFKLEEAVKNARFKMELRQEKMEALFRHPDRYRDILDIED